MHLTVAVFDDRVVPVEIEDAATIETLKAILEAETGLPAASQALIYNGNSLPSNTTLASHGVKSGELLMLMPIVQQHDASPSVLASHGHGAAPPDHASDGDGFRDDGSARNPEQLMSLLRSFSPAQFTQLPPSIAKAVESNDTNALQTALREIMAARRHAEAEEQKFMRLAADDPLNPEVQRRLEEIIQKKNVAENLESALEYNPEAFGSVVMLYVDMEVNGVKLKAFVDSGAQSTIMSKACAERCGLLRLLDTRFAGTAVGVGQAKILGRIHMAPLKAGGQHIPVSISVLEQDGMEFLFGLDNLKRHQCSIDLQSNRLNFPSMNTSLPFLPEHEIPKAGAFAADSGQPSAAPSPSPAPVAQPQLPTSAPPTAPGLSPEWETKVQRLMHLGSFQRAACIEALHAAEGNEDVAASFLFNL